MNYRLSILVLLGILLFVYHLGMGVYYGVGLEPSPVFDFLYSSAFICGIVWWLRADGQKYQVRFVYCLGVLVGIAWPILIPYHLFKTRGRRGFIPLLIFIGIFLAAFLLAGFLAIGLHLLRGENLFQL
jgi:hypothetical protein